jgi:hypothetical protein
MKTFFTTSSLLGIKVDRQGNLYVSGPGGSFPPRRNIWARSSRPGTRTTWRGAATTAGLFI